MRVSIFISILLIGLSSASLAAGKSCSVEFFASNNTGTIDLPTAYQRLTGNEELQLKNSMVTVLQKNHIEQGSFEDILGTYLMSDSGKITADNTDAFITSPYQCISDQKAFTIAQQLANKMNQESVAVFIASPKATIGELKVSFTTRNLSVEEVIAIVHDKLPATYAQAFSLHLVPNPVAYSEAKVAEIEWLGSKINIDEIKKAFPSDNVSFKKGSAYLVYKNGQKDQI